MGCAVKLDMVVLLSVEVVCVPKGALAAPGFSAADAGGEPPSGFVGRTGSVCQVAPPQQDQRRVGGADQAGGLGGVGAERVAPSDPGGDAGQVAIEGVVAEGSGLPGRR